MTGPPPPGARLRFAWVNWILAFVAVSGCATRQVSFPSDPGISFSAYEQVFREATSGCLDVSTFIAELSLTGRIDDQGIRGRVQSGFSRPGAVRLEGVAPFGQPVFILVARQSDDAVLWLPRESRVVRGPSAAEILEAIAGVALAPDDLSSVLTGCVVPDPRPLSARLYDNGLVGIALEGDATVFLARDGNRWRPRMARVSDWMVDYPVWTGRFPSEVVLRSVSRAIELRVGVSQLQANTPIDQAAFTVTVPATAQALSLTELREAGPLGVGTAEDGPRDP